MKFRGPPGSSPKLEVITSQSPATWIKHPYSCFLEKYSSKAYIPPERIPTHVGLVCITFPMLLPSTSVLHYQYQHVGIQIASRTKFESKPSKHESQPHQHEFQPSQHESQQSQCKLQSEPPEYGHRSVCIVNLIPDGQIR